MRKILLLTDSLALPRAKPESCAHEDTWPELLKGEGNMVHQVSIGGSTSEDLLNQIHYHKEVNPTCVIVQVGVVDCAPRFASKLELAILRKAGRIGNLIIKKLNNRSVRKFRNINYVKPDFFENNIHQIQKIFAPIPVYFIGILPALPAYEKLVPGISKRIEEYNQILSKQFNYIAVDDFDPLGLMTDYHHLNAIGQKQILDIILHHLDA